MRGRPGMSRRAQIGDKSRAKLVARESMFLDCESDPRIRPNQSRSLRVGCEKGTCRHGKKKGRRRQQKGEKEEEGRSFCTLTPDRPPLAASSGSNKSRYCTHPRGIHPPNQPLPPFPGLPFRDPLKYLSRDRFFYIFCMLWSRFP